MSGNKNNPQFNSVFSLKTVWLLVCLLMLITGCSGGLFGGGDDAAEAAGDGAGAAIEIAPQTGSLICSESCAAEGQCGTRADGSSVILAHSVQPATRDHDRLLPVESPIVILNRQPRLVQRVTGEQLTVEFFQVQMNEGGAGGWVAAWCVNVDQ